MGSPVAEFGAHLLINVLRLADAVDGDVGVGEDEIFEMLRVVDDVFVDEDLDAFFQHDTVFGGLFALLLFALLPFDVAAAAVISELVSGNLHAVVSYLHLVAAALITVTLLLVAVALLLLPVTLLLHLIEPLLLLITTLLFPIAAL